MFFSQNNTEYCVVYDVVAEHGRKVITVRSPLQVNFRIMKDIGVVLCIFTY